MPRIIYIVCFILMAVSKAVASPQQETPSRFQIFEQLLRNADLPLERMRHCAGVIGEQENKNPTLGDWVAYNLSVLKDGEVDMPAECRHLREGLFQCEISFKLRQDKQNLLWNWGVRFQIDSSTRQARPDSFLCTGSG